MTTNDKTLRWQKLQRELENQLLTNWERFELEREMKALVESGLLDKTYLAKCDELGIY